MCVPAWGSAELNLGAYLNRTGYRGPLEPTAATLRDLHRCHDRRGSGYRGCP